ncbi:MAG TPA: HD domain-containing phosphohydrolase [Thermoanaerobaculia bacterium]|jgi:putative nucleotidyltransferase with HDIG domain|nr:HD domain-containing phosphohydrolase [Thermoanaerobaculia bacterium]
MTTRRKLLRRIKLRHVLVVLVLLSSGVPLLISSALLIPKAREVLEDAERDYLTRKALALSREIDTYLATVRRQLTQLGTGLLLAPGAADIAARLHEPWVAGYLQSFAAGSPDLRALYALDLQGEGPRRGPSQLSADAEAALNAVFEQARATRAPAYRLINMGPRAVPNLALAVPAAAGAAPAGGLSGAGSQGAPGGAGGPPPQLVVEALLELKPLGAVFQGEARKEVGVFLLDRHGQILWSDSAPGMAQALVRSELVKLFVKRPMSLTRQYEFSSPRGRQEVLAQVSAINETSWGVVVQKPLSSAYAVVDQMVLRTVLATLPLMVLSACFAFLAARWVGRPIQRLTETTHEIAAGSFGGRVEMKGLSFEVADLAEDFNRMSGHVQSYVQQLREAAQVNRDLFIGSLRAFAAAIDAKDPYTRGHSERVAAVSRVIARHLLLSEDVQHKVWIGALLHDVGKIGVEDTILRKETELTVEEYEQMKMHTVIGAEIMQPIEQLREMIPAIHWHHEAWNGRGYPDALRGEQIPLFARIVAVADTFDAITTNRPYQQAGNLQFAVDTITRLTGSRFDAKVVSAFLSAVQAGEVRPMVPREGRVTLPEIEARTARRR